MPSLCVRILNLLICGGNMAEYKIRAFLDTNILIDLLMEGRPGTAFANSIFQAAKGGHIEVFLTTQSFIDAEYVLSHSPAFNRERVFDAMLKLMGYANVGHIFWTDIRNAILNFSGDFEDDAQFSNACFEGCDVIVTADKEFLHRKVSEGPMVLTPKEFVERLTNGQ